MINNSNSENAPHKLTDVPPVLIQNRNNYIYKKLLKIIPHLSQLLIRSLISFKCSHLIIDRNLYASKYCKVTIVFRGINFEEIKFRGLPEICFKMEVFMDKFLRITCKKFQG